MVNGVTERTKQFTFYLSFSCIGKCLAQGHFNTWTGENRDRSANSAISGQRTSWATATDQFQLVLQVIWTSYEQIVRNEWGRKDDKRKVKSNLISLLLCSALDLFVSGHPADAHTWYTLLCLLCVCVCLRRKEIKEGGDGQMEELSEGCSSVLVYSHVCFHEREFTDDVIKTTCATSAWCVCVFKREILM